MQSMSNKTRKKSPNLDAAHNCDEYDISETDSRDSYLDALLGRTSMAQSLSEEGKQSEGKDAVPRLTRNSEFFESGAKSKSAEHLHARLRSPGLFVSDDEPQPELEATIDSTYVNQTLRESSTVDSMKRACSIKSKIVKNIPVLQRLDKMTSIRRVIADDPENQLIKQLREEQNMGWKDIANHINKERINRGEPVTFTESTAYSRFVLNTPHLATSVREIGFDSKDYAHLRHTKSSAMSGGTSALSTVGRKRIKNYGNAKELEANMRQVIKQEELTELETAERTEQLMEAVSKVERNFWVLVADEMERMTTRLYPADALAKRYHAI